MAPSAVPYTPATALVVFSGEAVVVRGKWLLAGALAVALISPTTALASTNLIKNGGFETPTVPGGSYAGYSTGQGFSHWTVVGASGNVDIVSGTFTQNGFSFPAKGGSQWLDLTGVSNTATGVAQTVTTSPGSAYTLTFGVGNVYDPGGIFGVTSTVQIIVDGVQVASDTNSKGRGTPSMVWQTFHVGFTASAASTTIEFINGDPSNDTANGLDGVKLTLG